MIRGYNDDEVVDLLEFARARGAEPRFIEYMDVGGATDWSMDQVVSQREILDIVARRLRAGRAAERRTPGRRPSGSRCRTGRVFGVIASTTAPFCRTCDRSRLTADGTFLLCLYGEDGLDLRELLRGGATDEEIAGRIAETWTPAHRPGSGGAGGLRRPGRPAPDREPPRRSSARDAHPRRLMALQVALIQPQIPPNTGNIARLCAATDTPLHLIEPLGFSLTTPTCAARGWTTGTAWTSGVHPDWFAFRDAMDRSRCLYFSAKAERSYWEAPYRPNSCLVFGSETEGMPARILEKHPERCFTIPMTGAVRSLNLATAVGIVLYEALRADAVRARFAVKIVTH